MKLVEDAINIVVNRSISRVVTMKKELVFVDLVGFIFECVCFLFVWFFLGVFWPLGLSCYLGLLLYFRI